MESTRPPPSQAARLRTTQVYLAVCGATNLIMHFVYRATVPGVWDSLLERSLLAAFFLTGAASPLFVKPERRLSTATTFLTVASLLEALWLARGLYENQLRMEFTLGAHTAFYVFFFFQPTRLALYLYTTIGLAAFTVATFLAPQPAMSPTLAAGLVSAAPLFGWAMLGKLDVEDRLAALQAELASLAFKDPLTGLFNRRALSDFFEKELAAARRTRTALGVVVLDLDHFKRSNDTHGHSGGDALLKGVATVLRAGVRTEDFVCRFGGEEFVILLRSTDPAHSSKRIQKLLADIRALQIPHEGKVISTTASAGVAWFPLDGDSSEQVLAAADLALYRAKQSGRDRVECSPSLQGAPGQPNLQLPQAGATSELPRPN